MFGRIRAAATAPDAAASSSRAAAAPSTCAVIAVPPLSTELQSAPGHWSAQSCRVHLGTARGDLGALSWVRQC